MTGELGEKFTYNVSLSLELELGFDVDGATIGWWMGQAMINKCTWMKQEFAPEIAWSKLALFLKGSSFVWSHSTFDAPIIFYHFKKLKIGMPVKYAAWLDLRTLSQMTKGVYSIPKQVRPDDAHDALADAVYQAEWASKCYQILKGVKHEGVEARTTN
jgi:hypothetical protein